MVPIPVIGVVRTARTSLEHTPVQAALNRAEPGRIEIDPRYGEGLDGLEGFGFAWLLTSPRWNSQASTSRQPAPRRCSTRLPTRPAGRHSWHISSVRPQPRR
jgi:tRNA (Thr-GGU) A37 N-methylase